MGDDLARYPALLGLFAEAGKSAALVDRLVGRLLPELAAHPLGQIPFRHQYSGGMAIIQVVAASEAALSLVLYERGAATDSPQTVCFTDSERHEIALSGARNLQIFERDMTANERSRLRCRPMTLGQGQSLSLSGMYETKFIEQVEDRLVILRLSRTAAARSQAWNSD